MSKGRISDAHLTCEYCGGKLPDEEQVIVLADDLSVCTATCAMGYLGYIACWSDEELQIFQDEVLGRRVALPPPAHEMRHWDPASGLYDQADMLALEMEQLSLGIGCSQRVKK